MSNSSVPERTMSTEMEYAVYDPVRGEQPSLSRSAMGRSNALEDTQPFGLSSIGSFLSNGARRYQEGSGQIEYAAPECLGPLEATAYDQAGEDIVTDTASQLTKFSNRRYNLNKRLCSDAPDTTAGAHHNFGITRQLFYEIKDPSEDSIGIFAQGLIATHQATHTVYSGAGAYIQTSEGLKYFLSQKRWNIAAVATTSSTQQKPLINLRDEPHEPEGSEFARLHIASAEANMNPWPTWMQLGTMSILLRALEAGWTADVPILVDPVEAAVIVSQDRSQKATFRTWDERELTAAQIQYEYAEFAQRAIEKGMLSDEEELVANDWAGITEDLVHGRAYDNPDRIDYVMRDLSIEHAIDRQDTDEATKDMLFAKLPVDTKRKALDRLFDLTDDSGTGRKCRRRGMYALRFSESEIEDAIHKPPDTRARTRSEIISKVKNRSNVAVDWSAVSVADSGRLSLGTAGVYRPDIAEEVIALANKRR